MKRQRFLRALIGVATLVLLGTNPLVTTAQLCQGYLVVVLTGSPFTGTADITESTNDYDGRTQDLGTTCGLVIHGNNNANIIHSSGGTDFIYGYGGNDTLYGEEGDDVIQGLDGDDMIWGGADNSDGTNRSDGNDIVDSGDGNDVIFGGNLNANGAVGADGDDVLSGGAGDDRLFGGNHNQAQSAGDDGNDTLDGGAGGDTLYGGNHNDGGSGADANDTVVGGDGVNTLAGGNLNQAGGTGNDAGGDIVDAVNNTVDTSIIGGNSDDPSTGIDTIRYDQAEFGNITCDADDYCEADLGGTGEIPYTFQGGIPEQAGAPLGLNQSTLVIYVRASDNNTSNLDVLRTNEQAEFGNVSTFFNESSFNQVSFAYTHAPATGWYQLPRTYDNYMWTQADITAAQATCPSTGSCPALTQAQNGQALVQDFANFFTDAMQAAQSDGNNVSNFSQVVVVIIGPFHRGTSYGTANFTLTNNAGQPFQVSVPTVVVSTNTGWSRTGHEFGHAFGGFADLYPATTRRMGQWDVMDCTDCGAQTTGWHKDRAGWYNAFSSAMRVVTRPTGNNRVDFTQILVPYETATPAPNTIHTIRLDVGGGMHLYIENRQRITGQIGSQGLPGSGVIITDADDAGGAFVGAPIRLFGGPLRAGDTFTDSTYGNLRISVAQDPGSTQNLVVTVGWGADPYFDLSISPWTPPPWESPDIWIDSPANSYGTFEFTDSGGQPIRNGDRPQTGVDNRIFARVHNEGNVAANNVRVAFYITTPAGIGDSGNWTLLDRVTISSIGPGATVVSPSVNWRPTAGSHTCIIARIEYQTGELNANNNEAQENINDFNTTTNSPWTLVESEVEVTNPTPRYQVMRMEMTGLPTGWTATVSDRFVELAPGETARVQYTIDPGNQPNANVCLVDVNLVGWLLEGEGEVALGGVTAAVHLIHPSNVEIEWFDNNEPPNEDDQERPREPDYGQIGARIHVVSNGDTRDIPVTLEVIDPVTGDSAMATGITDINGNVTITLDGLDGGFALQPGERYIVRATADGNACVERGNSEEIEVTIWGEPSQDTNLNFNPNSATLANEQIYCAATYAIDYQRLQDEFDGQGQTFTTNAADPTFDPDRAGNCLGEVGEDFFLNICVDERDEFGRRIAEMVTSDLANLDIGFELVVLDSNSLQQAIEDGRCDVIVRGFAP